MENLQTKSTLSEFNSTISFKYKFTESRIKKCLKIMEKFTPGTFLDLGTVNGELLEFMAQRGWKTYGVDINPANIAVCVEKKLDVRLCNLSIDALPFDDKQFDLIFAGEIIEHLVDTDRFLQEMARCIKTNGDFIITTPNLSSFENRIRLLFGVYPEWVDWCTTEGVGHVRAYTAKILKRQLMKHGFRPISTLGNWVPFLPQQIINDQHFPWLGITGYMFPTLSQGLIIHAKKIA